MKFANREDELGELEEYYNLSKRKLFPVSIYGLRRVGKTELVKKFARNKDHIYLFVYGNKTQKSLLEEFERELKRYDIIDKYTRLRNWNEFLEIIFNKCENKVVIFDEFQNFRNVYPGFFSMLQRKIDENQERKMMLIFLGSIIGLIKKVFDDRKEPLYGRMKTKMKLSPMKYSDIKGMLKTLGYKKDFVEFYSVFGGIPKYYVAIEDFNLNKKSILEIINYFFLRENAPFEYEVLDILRQELGKRKGVYYTIIEAIATGNTKLNEIGNYVGISSTSLTRYLQELLEEYEIIEKMYPVTEDPKKSKKTIYKIRNPMVSFWFRYFHKNMSLFEAKNFEELNRIVKKDINNFIGKRFENICKEFLPNKMPFEPQLLGNWWGFRRDGDERKEIEIDLVGLNKNTKEIMFTECKWQDNVNPEKVLEELREKSKYVNWFNKERKEFYCIIAKSFDRKVRKKNVYLFDLKDIDKT